MIDFQSVQKATGILFLINRMKKSSQVTSWIKSISKWRYCYKNYSDNYYTWQYVKKHAK